MVKHKDEPDLILTEDLSIHFIELTKESVGNDKLSDWIRFLQTEGEEESDMTVLIKRNQIFAEVDNAFRRTTQDQAAREEALAREKFQRDELSRLRQAERRGKAEGNIETARGLKKLGVDPKIISQATGLSLEILAEL